MTTKRREGRPARVGLTRKRAVLFDPQGHDRADVLVVSDGFHLSPLIQVVTDAGPDPVRPEHRRTRRLR